MAASFDPPISVVLSGLAAGSFLFVMGSAVTAHYQRNPWKLPLAQWLEWRLVPAALYSAGISFLLALTGWYAALPLRYLLSKTQLFPAAPTVVAWLLLVAFASATPYLFQTVTHRL